MKALMIGGPRDGTWIDVREGQRYITIPELAAPFVVAPRGHEIPQPLPTYKEYTYHFTRHDDNTVTFNYVD